MLTPTPDFEWADYFEAIDKGKLHPLYAQLDAHLSPGLTALDLGCGVGHGTLHLCNRGLIVTAVDVSADGLARLKQRVPPDAAVTLVESDFRLLEFPVDAFDIVTATNALYFLPPADFPIFWPKLLGWMRPGGVFIGQFMGPRDAWADRDDYSKHSADQVKALFEGFELLHLHDDERDSVNCMGKNSHVHIIHAVAKKLAG